MCESSSACCIALRICQGGSAFRLLGGPLHLCTFLTLRMLQVFFVASVLSTVDSKCCETTMRRDAMWTRHSHDASPCVAMRRLLIPSIAQVLGSCQSGQQGVQSIAKLWASSHFGQQQTYGCSRIILEE